MFSSLIPLYLTESLDNPRFKANTKTCIFCDDTYPAPDFHRVCSYADAHLGTVRVHCTHSIPIILRYFLY